MTYLMIIQLHFQFLKRKKKDDLISFLERCFPGRWVYETIKYFEMNGDGREFVVVEKERSNHWVL